MNEEDQKILNACSAFATPLVDESCGTFESAVLMIQEAGLADSVLEAIQLLGETHADVIEKFDDINVPIMESAEEAVEDAARDDLENWLGTEIFYESPGSGCFDFSDETRELIEKKLS